MPRTLLSRSLTEYARTSAFRNLDPSEAAERMAGGCGCESSTNVIDRANLSLRAAASPPGRVTWSGVVAVEGELTGDGRMIEHNALRWEDLPLVFRAAPTDVGAHDGAEVTGRILTLERQSDGKIWGTGDFDLGSEAGREAIRKGLDELMNGISVDLDSVSFEVRVAKELLDMGPEPEDGDSAEIKVPDEDDDGRIKVIEINADDEVMVTTDARLRAATIVQIPAFSSARFTLDDPEEARSALDEVAGAEITPALVAGAVPIEPPAAWFDDPHFTEPTPLSVAADGRVSGHIAIWGTCHTGYPGQCVSPPDSPSDYAYFRRGSVLTAEGTEVPTGALTMSTLHAKEHLGAADTIAHYEHTGRAAADVAVGEDDHGIWVAGALRSTLTSEQVRELRASPLSGDWRRVGGHLELLAALAVNVPGFPVPRPKGLVASGVMTSLVASGMLPPRLRTVPSSPHSLSEEDWHYLKRAADRERAADQNQLSARAEQLASKVRASRAAALAKRVGVS